MSRRPPIPSFRFGSSRKATSPSFAYLSRTRECRVTSHSRPRLRQLSAAPAITSDARDSLPARNRAVTSDVAVSRSVAHSDSVSFGVRTA